MSSGRANTSQPGQPGQRQEFVFCHECEEEWRYTGEHSLICPRCHSDFVEIIENNATDPSRIPFFDTDSDGEDDPAATTATRFTSSFVITGPGIHIHRTIGAFPGAPRPSTGRPASAGAADGQRLGGSGEHGAAGAAGTAGGRPQDVNMVEMLQTIFTRIMGETAAERARQNASSPPPATGDHTPQDPRLRTPQTPGVSGGEHAGGPQTPGGAPAPQVVNLAAFIHQVFGAQSDGPMNDPAAGFISTILGMPPGGHGDYVFSQGQLDRVISELMEQHQGNAPPPAPPEILNNLPKIKVDAQRVIEGEDCTVCKEELNIDEEVAQLPCKHVYHEECIKRWLETRDTCPVCRAPTAPEHHQSTDNAAGGHATTTTNSAGTQVNASATATATAGSEQSASSGQQQQQQHGGGGIGGWFFGRS